VRHFARVFEATWMLNCQLPLDLRARNHAQMVPRPHPQHR
jgi:hypothetical protein